ncbi:MAG: hypothetical protein ACI4HQ_14875 [Acetatifactor sp.]
MKKYKNIFAISLLTGMLLSGCGTSVPPSSLPASRASDSLTADSQATGTPASEAASGEQTNESQASETLSITILNLCGVDIGMLAVIDPVTGEQVNIGSLANEEALTLNNWPVDVTTIQWAVYNQRGELYQEAATDIRDAKTGVSIVLKGNGSIDNVETSFY